MTTTIECPECGEDMHRTGEFHPTADDIWMLACGNKHIIQRRGSEVELPPINHALGQLWLETMNDGTWVKL